MVAAYNNTGWMSPELVNVISPVVNDCRVCQKFQKSITRPRVTLPKASSFKEIITLDLKEFDKKYVLWMVDGLADSYKVSQYLIKRQTPLSPL